MKTNVMTKTLAESWYDAILNRHSVRTFTGDPLSDDVLNRLEEAGAQFSGGEARAVVSSEPIHRVLQGLDDLTRGLPRSEWPGWMQTALEAARLAPSTMNWQPWRFKVAAGHITLNVDNLDDSYHVAKRLDCGIAMLHLEVGARQAGVEGRWEFLEPPGVARFSV